MGIQLIVGLGNPGKRYEGTRHNVGFLAIDRFLDRSWAPVKAEWKSWLRGAGSYAQAGLPSVWVAKPLTYMNVSGDYVQDFSRFHKIQPCAILMVYDDMDLPLGRIRIRKCGSSGGHKGAESIITRLGTQDIARLRIGIGRSPADVQGKEYVLNRFSASERKVVDGMLDHAADAIGSICQDGLDAAMNVYNAKPAEL